jgi:hypothetical protein
VGALVRGRDGAGVRTQVGLDVGLGVTSADEGNPVGESVVVTGANVGCTGDRLVGDREAGL